MHTYFLTRITLPKFVSLTWNFQNFFNRHLLILSLSLSVYAFMNFMNLIKASNFTDVKLDLN